MLLLFAGCRDAGPEITLVIEPPASTEVTVGDILFLSVEASPPVGAQSLTWTSSNPQVASVVGGGVEALRPGSTIITVSASGAVPSEIGLTMVARAGGYSAAEVDYFGEIAFGAEFGSAPPLLHRWRTGSGPLIRVNGTPSPGDLVVLDSVIAEINRLAPLDIEIVSDFPTVEMHFIPQSQFQDVLPQAPAGNNGLVWIWWGTDQYVNRSVVLISTTTAEPLRAHIIREEITQMLGLLQDSFTYPLSIFYQAFSDVTAFQPIDRTVIELLHRPELSVGMSRDQAQRIVRTLLRPTPGAAAVERAPESRGRVRMTRHAVTAGSAGGSSR